MIQIPDSKFPLELTKKFLNKLFCISIGNAKKTLMSIVLEEAHAFLLSSY